MVILDLEDAVAPANKESSLRSVVAWAGAHERCMVRLNGVDTPWSDREVSALRGTGIAVMLPKAERVDDASRLADALADSAVVGLVETPRGVMGVEELARSGALARLALGNVDLALGLGVDPASRAALAPARWSLVMASAAEGLPAPIDGVTTVLDDPALLAGDIGHARELGFGGRLCIHPRQVAPTNIAMSPSAEEVAWARRVLLSGVERGTEEAVRVVDGSMVDAPVVDRARRLLARAGIATTDSVGDLY
jgi:citrate lyase subunit beta/citryl-CoA lyase